MTDKEKLETLKKYKEYHHFLRGEVGTWFIQQCEKVEKQEEALKELQWKLKTAKNCEHEEVVFESILIVDRALEEG